MATPFKKALSLTVGWLADLRIPTFLRPTIYRGYARFTGADLSEARLPLASYPCLGAFFVRRLKEDARPVDATPENIVSPVDGKVLHVSKVTRGTLLQIKGLEYSVSDFLDDESASERWEGGTAWTIYLSPRDYHRIHTPEACRLNAVRWIEGARHSVAPHRIARHMVFPVNERVVCELETDHGPLCLVLVGALNVGRMRVVGVEPYGPAPSPAKTFARGDELARFEMGSTIVLFAPAGQYQPAPALAPETPVKLGTPIGSLARARSEA